MDAYLSTLDPMITPESEDTLLCGRWRKPQCEQILRRDGLARGAEEINEGQHLKGGTKFISGRQNCLFWAHANVVNINI